MMFSRLHKPHRAKSRSVLHSLNVRLVGLKKFLNLTLVLLSACTLLVPVSTSADEAESKVKAAFLYKFCDYIQWPAQVFTELDSPIILAVAGTETQVAQITSMVSGRYIGQRALVVRAVNSPDDLRDVHLLYISRNAQTSLDELFANTGSLPILTISDEEAASAASIITFLTIQDRIRFEISLGRANEVGIKLSSELLAVAHKVYEGKRK